MAYEIVVDKGAKKDLKKIKDKKLQEIMLKVIFDELGQDAYKGKVLKGLLSDFRSIKVRYSGVDYRIGYQVRGDKIVVILLVAPRENFYDKFKRRANQ